MGNFSVVNVLDNSALGTVNCGVRDTKIVGINKKTLFFYSLREEFIPKSSYQSIPLTTQP
jgi:hypothetical protein